MNDPVWKPLLTIGNSYDGKNYIYKDDMIKRVLYNGVMHWNAAKILKSRAKQTFLNIHSMFLDDRTVRIS